MNPVLGVLHGILDIFAQFAYLVEQMTAHLLQPCRGFRFGHNQPVQKGLPFIGRDGFTHLPHNRTKIFHGEGIQPRFHLIKESFE
ncbi:MAG: hypothetical protein HQL31_11995 [Planctomycetes bacterium]|nr:hypothetical protein [Planctomycetota bacterium]